MKTSTKNIWIFTIYFILLVGLSLAIFALFPYLPYDFQISHKNLELILFMSVNIITNLYLTVFYVGDKIREKKCVKALMWMISILINALFALFVVLMLKERPPKEPNSQ